MRPLLTYLGAAVLLGAGIGGLAGWAGGEFRLDSAAGGAVIGAVIGGYFAARMKLHRHTMRRDD